MAGPQAQPPAGFSGRVPAPPATDGNRPQTKSGAQLLPDEVPPPPVSLSAARPRTGESSGAGTSPHSAETPLETTQQVAKALASLPLVPAAPAPLDLAVRPETGPAPAPHAQEIAVAEAAPIPVVAASPEGRPAVPAALEPAPEGGVAIFPPPGGLAEGIPGQHRASFSWTGTPVKLGIAAVVLFALALGGTALFVVRAMSATPAVATRTDDRASPIPADAAGSAPQAALSVPQAAPSVAEASPASSATAPPLADVDFRKPVSLPLAFERGSAVFSISDSGQLEAVLAAARSELASKRGVRMEVGGHTSAEGPPRYNTELGYARAKAAAGVLAEHGISSERLLIKSYGTALPLTRRWSEDKQVANRRVTLRIVR